MSDRKSNFILLLFVCALALPAGLVSAQPRGASRVAPEVIMGIPAEIRREAGTLIIQDFQGRMKPLDTLACEVLRKVSKRSELEGLGGLDLYLSWLVAPEYWSGRPLVFVRYPGLKDALGVDTSVRHVSLESLFDASGRYVLEGQVNRAYQTPDRERSKLERKLIAFDERVNIAYQSMQGRTLRVFPLPGDPAARWSSAGEIMPELSTRLQDRYRLALIRFLEGLRSGDGEGTMVGITAIREIQREFGAELLPGKAALAAELLLNRVRPFQRAPWLYLIAFIALLIAFVWSLIGRGGKSYRWRHPLYAMGMLLYSAALIFHLWGYVLRWIASGRAPLGNGFESLLFISLAVAVAGMIYEVRERRGALAAIGALLAFMILGISMMSLFDPGIGLLVPVLDSNWLIIHVTVVTASYGFLGLSSFLGAMILCLYLFKGPGREAVHENIVRLDRLLFLAVSVGLALLTVGTLLGGVWANESWGRYWGWDPKETWSLVTILVFAMVTHSRWLPSMNRSWFLAAGSFLGFLSIAMTYFGVNFFLVGLHSYAQAGAATVPRWGIAVVVGMLALVLASLLRDRTRCWDREHR